MSMPPLGPSEPLVPPLYQSSVYTLPDVDALDRVMNGEVPGYIYARDAHPNGKHLAAELAALQGATWALMGSSGMASISTIVLALTQMGDRIVASNRLYGRTVQFFNQELSRFGLQTSFVDCNDLDAVRKALEQPARLLFVETMSNPMLRVVDIAVLAEMSHSHNCRLIVDNTFATPVLTRPLDLGADVVMESLTKMIGGHSDVTLGLIAGKGEDSAEMLQQVTATSSIWGFSANPFECWLAQRNLSTLTLRMRAACANAAALAEWLASQPNVTRVVYPGRSDHLDHVLAGRVCQGGYGNMLCFEVAGDRDGVNRLMQQAPEIPFSPSLGHTTTTSSHPWTTSHRYTSPAEKKRQGITEGLVRLSVGVEAVEQTKSMLEKGLS